MSDAAGERAYRLQPLTVPQLLLQFFALNFGDFLFLDFCLQAIVHAHQFTAHVFQVRRELVKLADSRGDLQCLRIVAGRDRTRHVLQAMDRAGQSMTQNDRDDHRDAEIHRQHHQHAVEREVNTLQCGLLVESQPQFRIPAQHHEVDFVTALGESQIRAARCFDVG